MGFFDFLKSKAKGAQARPTTGHLGGRAPSKVEKEFFKHRRQTQTHRGEFGPAEFRDVPAGTYSLEAIRFTQDGEWQTVTSSWHIAAKYDLDTLTLTINFIQGGGMRVSDVDEAEARGYITADSHGGWVWDNVLGRYWKRGGITLKPVDWFK